MVISRLKKGKKKGVDVDLTELAEWLHKHSNLKIDEDLLKIKHAKEILEIKNKHLKRKNKDPEIKKFTDSMEQLLSSITIPNSFTYKNIRKFLKKYNEVLDEFNDEVKTIYPYLNAVYSKDIKGQFTVLKKINSQMTKINYKIKKKKLFLIEDVQESLKIVEDMLKNNTIQKEYDKFTKKRKKLLKQEDKLIDHIHKIKESKEFLSFEDYSIKLQEVQGRIIVLKKQRNKKDAEEIKQELKELEKEKIKLQGRLSGIDIEERTKKYLKELNKTTKELSKVDERLYELRDNSMKKEVEKIEKKLSRMGHKVNIKHAALDTQT